MIAHLEGREKALEPFGWRGRRAKWIVLACLHSGGFTRAQLAPISGSIADRRIGSSGPCSSEGLTAEDMLERRKVCRIFGRGICRALGAEHIRHGRAVSEEVLTRRRLSLDYVLEHPGLPRRSARVRADRSAH